MKNDHEISFLIHGIDKKLKASIDAGLNKYELTFSQSQVLFILHKNGNRLSQKKLQELMNVSHPTMVGLIQRLEANGFVKTTVDEEDKRNKIVERTAKAEAFGSETNEARIRMDKAMLTGICKEEKEILRDLLDRIYRNVCEVKI